LEKGEIKGKDFRKFAFDLMEVHFRQSLKFKESSEDPILGNFGEQYTAIAKHPLTYIQ
jgi:hypothetical protein